MSDWISVSEEHPEYREDVLIYTNREAKKIAVGRLTPVLGSLQWGIWSSANSSVCLDMIPKKDVLFWMPLPKKPSWWNIRKEKKISRAELMDFED